MYEFGDHTADIIVRAYGKDWNEVFNSMGKALFAAMVDLEKVRPLICREFSLTAETLEDLLVDFLNTLLVYKDAENMAFSHFDVEISPDWKLTCRACGEKIKPEHNPRSDVKAVSYHMLELGEKEGKKYAQVVLDL